MVLKVNPQPRSPMFQMTSLRPAPSNTPFTLPTWLGHLSDGRTIRVEKHDEDADKGYFYAVKFQGVEVLKGWFDGFDTLNRPKALIHAINALLKTPEQMKESIERTGIGDAPADILEALKDALDGDTTEQVVEALKQARANTLDLLQVLDRMLDEGKRGATIWSPPRTKEPHSGT
jgi:hypothetical protein